MALSKVFARSLGLSCKKPQVLQPVCQKLLGRMYSRPYNPRSDCNAFEPRCSPQVLSQSPCAARKLKERETGSAEFRTIWENPECCVDPCKDAFPRFDDLYYKPSDKNREYQQTWVECPQLVVRPKLMCCYDPDRLPPIQRRRPKGECPKTASCFRAQHDRDLMNCGKLKIDPQCLRITLPGCRMPRFPPRCTITRQRSTCKKVCAPYPSYSECQRPKAKSRRPCECFCLSTPSMCEAFAEMKRRSMFKQVPGGSGSDLRKR